MSGGEAVERDAGFAHQPRQQPELERGVAEDAGIRGFAAQRGLAEHPHDRALVLARAVDHLVADAERVREFLGAGDVLRFAGPEARVALAAAVGAAPELHGDTDHLVPLLLQDERGDARVDAFARIEQVVAAVFPRGDVRHDDIRAGEESLFATLGIDCLQRGGGGDVGVRYGEADRGDHAQREVEELLASEARRIGGERGVGVGDVRPHPNHVYAFVAEELDVACE